MSIVLELSAVPCIGASMQQNGVPLIREVSLRHDDPSLGGLFRLRLSASPEIFSPYEAVIEADAGSWWRSGPIQVILHWKELAALTEGVKGLLLIELEDMEGRVLLTREQELRFLAFDQWQGGSILPELLAAFITPNHTRIPGLLRRAADMLSEWGEPPSLNEYQSRSPHRVRKQAAAIYSAISELDLTYASSPASFEEAGQRIRLCDQIFDQGIGNCLDMSLLYASCLEAAGLHPIVVIVQGHAFAGVWLVEETFPDPVNDDPTLLTKRVAEGIHDLMLVEATGMNRGSNMDFETAVALAGAKLLKPDEFHWFLDVKRARQAGVRPLPVRIRSSEGWVIGEPEVREGSTVAPADIIVGPRPEELPVAVHTRQQTWERRLLDLTLRNTLLSLRPSRTHVQLLTANLAGAEDRLGAGEELQLLPAPTGWQGEPRPEAIFRPLHTTDAVHGLVAGDEQQRRLRTCLGEAQLQSALTSLYRSARLSLEENGANTLFLAIGLMRWYESDASERPRLAPVLLMPVELVRKASHRGYVLRSREEEAVANVTLLEMLRQDFGITLAGLEQLPRDETGVDVRTSLNLFRHAVRGMPRWDVEDVALLGNFSFSRFVMWNDIRSNAKRLASHPIIQSLMDGRLHPELPSDQASDVRPGDLPFTEVLLPILADGSQVEAIRAANEGRSFVLHGPPGTGKSQTITNIIANALYQGRRVLFVAEKMAALEVVEKRLQEIGLGDFCLELHSNKTRKSDVLRRLKAMIDAPMRRALADFPLEASRIQELRSSLGAYTSALHRTQPSGLSVFECINRYLPHANCQADIHFDPAFIRNLDSAGLIRIEDSAEDVQAALSLTGDPCTHPLREIGLDAYNPTLRESAAASLRVWSETLQSLLKAIARISESLGLRHLPTDKRNLEALAQACRILLGTADLRGSMLMDDSVAQRLTETERLASTGEEMLGLESALDAKLRERWRSLDASSMLIQWQSSAYRWFLPRYLIRRKVRGRLTKISRTGTLEHDDIENLLKSIGEWQSRLHVIEKSTEDMRRFMPSVWSGQHTDWHALRVLTASYRSLLESLPGLCTDVGMLAVTRTTMAERLREGSLLWARYHGEVAQTFITMLGSVVDMESTISDLLSLQPAGGDGHGDDWLGKSAKRAEILLSGITRLRDWCTWRSTRAQVIKQGLGAWVASIDMGKMPSSEATTSLRKNLYRALANEGIARETDLSSFNGILFDEKVRRFTALSHAFELLTRQEILNRLHARRPDLSALARKGTEVGVLQRVIAGNGRGYSIRMLFDEASKLLADICPCMLMSPISVAQYLAMDKSGFDMVIFDEASQMPTSEAVGSIARGKSLIVVGDPRQMPPTSFFGSQSYDEDNAQSEDLESILDDCLALSFPNRHLRWHYRSRHESLIAFSNARFYENSLLTFPSPSDIGSRVRWTPVEGVYDRGGGRNNPAEARALVEEVIQRMKDASHQKKSIGIITFNMAQQRLLQDMLDDAISSDPELETAFLQSPEPLFVKNLENVQGDERDVILFSVGYGRDKTGRVSLNFGPLNREGGWRRLNVAVSRARDEMVVFSSLRPDDIDVSRTSSEGVAGLRAFLEYASAGSAALSFAGRGMASPKNNSVECAVAASLRAEGYLVHTHVGCSGFRIDVAVLHPADPSSYLLAVMCDGVGFLTTPSIRDRHVGRRAVLERLGWRVHQVWTAEWWEDPAMVTASIVKAIRAVHPEPQLDKYLQEVPEMLTTPVSVAMVEDVRTSSQLSGSRMYEVSKLEGSEGLSTEEILLPENQVLLRSQVRFVMMTEAPVTKRLLKRRVVASWGVGRVGSRIDRHLDAVITELGFMSTAQSSGEVLWMPGINPEFMQEFRVPADDYHRREPEDLPIQEVAAAAVAIVRHSYSITDDDLLRELASVFGFSRRSSSMDILLREGIILAAMFGRLKEVSGRYRI